MQQHFRSMPQEFIPSYPAYLENPPPSVLIDRREYHLTAANADRAINHDFANVISILDSLLRIDKSIPLESLRNFQEEYGPISLQTYTERMMKRYGFFEHRLSSDTIERINGLITESNVLLKNEIDQAKFNRLLAIAHELHTVYDC